MEQEDTYEKERDMILEMLKQVKVNMEKGEIKPIGLRVIAVTLSNVVGLVYDPLIQQERTERFANKFIEEQDRRFWDN